MTFVLFVLSNLAGAADYSYQARIDGMVCAFCAYNVGKTIGALPGVDAESVIVDLDQKLAIFHASTSIDRGAVSTAVTDSGFTLVALQQIENPATQLSSYQTTPIIELDLDGADAERFESILEALGAFASAQRLRVVIEAPEAIEIDVLAPILMGRDHALSVLFLPGEEDVIRLRMYPEALSAAR
jgi:mercuric ion binding protein